MEISLTALFLALTAVLNLWIGRYIYRRDPRAGQNRAFGFMATTIGAWTTALAFAHYGSVGHTWAVRFTFASATLITLGTLTFIERIPVGVIDHSRTRRWLFTPIGLVLCASSFSPWVVISATPGSNSSKVTYGPLHPVLGAYVILWLTYCVYLLASKYRASTGLLKLQIRYLIFAIAIPSGLVTATNLAFPLFLKTSTFSKYGPFFSLLMLGLIGHAIIRHRLMDMRVVVKRSAVYLAAFSVAGLILIILLVGSNLVLHDQHRGPLREVGLALAVAVFFSPLKSQIQRAFDRYLYREPYDYQRTIRRPVAPR
jgi:hypothetical protein